MQAAKHRPAGGVGADASNWCLVQRLLGLTWAYRKQVVIVIALQLVLLTLSLAGLGFLGLAVDVIGYGFDPQSKRPPQWPMGYEPPLEWSAFQQAMLVSGMIFAIAALRFIFDRWSTVRNALLSNDLVVDLRASVYDKLQRLSFRFFDANDSGSIINRVTGDVQAVRMFADSVMIPVLMLVISLAFYAAYMVSIHPLLSVACLATTPLLWLLTTWFSRLVKPAYKINRELFDSAVRVLSENAQGVHVVKGFARQSQEVEKFALANRAVADHKGWIFWRVSIFVPLIGFVPNLNLIVLMLYGGHIYMTDESFSLGDLIVFSGLLQQFSAQVGNIAQIANSVQQSLTGAARVFEVIDAPLEIESPTDAAPLGRAKGHLCFEDIGFGYADGTRALFNVSFEVQPGQVVAILGATGSGKSTLLSLIPRFYDPDNGRITLDGHDLRSYDLDDLRRNIGLVFQESFLFSTTVAQNIAFGHPTATRAQVQRAAQIACAHQFITTELKDGYDSILMESGSNLSGGQRQRLAIARALLLDPPILLMDDPTAAIDPETEHEILEAMAAAMSDRTTFVVAHRLSTLRRADLVIVLDHGRVVQVGTHEQLMETQGHYREAALVQSADDESKRLLGIEVDA